MQFANLQRTHNEILKHEMSIDSRRVLTSHGLKELEGLSYCRLDSRIIGSSSANRLHQIRFVYYITVVRGSLTMYK